MKEISSVGEDKYSFAHSLEDSIPLVIEKVNKRICLDREDIKLICENVKSSAQSKNIDTKRQIIDLIFAVLADDYPKVDSKQYHHTHRDLSLITSLTTPNLLDNIKLNEEAVSLIASKLNESILADPISQLSKIIAKNQGLSNAVQLKLVNFANIKGRDGYLPQATILINSLKHCLNEEKISPEVVSTLNELGKNYMKGKFFDDQRALISLHSYKHLMRTGHGSVDCGSDSNRILRTTKDLSLQKKADKLNKEYHFQHDLPNFVKKNHEDLLLDWDKKPTLEKEKIIKNTIQYLKVFSPNEIIGSKQFGLNDLRTKTLLNIVKDTSLDFSKINGVIKSLSEAIDVGINDDLRYRKIKIGFKSIKGDINPGFTNIVIAKLPLSHCKLTIDILKDFEKNSHRISGVNNTSLEKFQMLASNDNLEIQTISANLLDIFSKKTSGFKKLDSNFIDHLILDFPKDIKSREQLTEELIKFNPDNQQLKLLIPTLNEKLQLVDEYWHKNSQLVPIGKNICDYLPEDIRLWSQKVRSSDLSLKSDQQLAESLAVISRAVQITNGYVPRDIQKQSVLILLDSLTEGKGRLAQIKTGEGKSTITAMLAVAQNIFTGKKIDIITSSAPLARRDSEEQGLFYELFGLNCDHNITKPSDPFIGAKPCYTSDIVYGDSLSFQSDLLRSEFKGLGTRGDRNFEAVIVDEVDSMLIDEGSKIAKLASPICGMEHLETVFIFVAKYLERSGVDREFLSPVENFEQTKDHLTDLINDIVSTKVRYPRYLEHFVNQSSLVWASTALRAIVMRENVDYVIAQDKFGEKIIAPVDYNATGVVQSSTAWSGGLHQFLQIKHYLRITPESLTTSFISNMNFFKRYESSITGLTGTLGSKSSQKLLEDIYNIDIASIPTFKPQIIEEYPGSVVEDSLAHIQAISDSAIKEAKSGRGVLIISQTIADALEITKKIKEIGYPENKIKQYLRSDTKNSTFDGKAGSGDIIVATNLAGRGTDILTSKTVEEAGGLHVIVGFLPSNLRIQDQAFGRTSRQGNKGSAELIVHNTTGANLNDLKKLRDINEEQNVSTTKTDLLEKINFEDELFQRFNYEVYQQLKIIDPNKQKLMQAEDLWGFWLSRIKKTYDINKVEGRNSIEQAFQEFKIDIFEKYGDKNCYNIMVNPAYLTNIAINKLGVNGNYTLPCDLLKQAAQLDDNFSYQSHYLGAYSTLRSGDINGTSNKAAQERVEKAGQALFHFENALHQIENIAMPQLQSAILSLGSESEGTPLAKQIDNKLRLLTTTQSNITKNIAYLRDHNDPGKSKIKVADDSLQFYNELFRGIVSQKDIEEYANFGMQHIFDVTSQKLDKDHFSGTLVAIIGIAQVIVGVVVAVGSAGFAAEFGIGLAVGGAGDIITGMQHALKGQGVDMNQWATSKGIDLAVNLITAGISSKINAAKTAKALKTTEIAVVAKDLTLRQVAYEIGKRLVTTELVKFAVMGVERMAAKPIKGAQKELEFKIRQLFQEQENKQNLREMIVIDKLNPKFHGYIPQLQRQIDNLLNQKEDRFTSIAQNILTHTLTSSVKSSSLANSSNISTAIQIGSVGLTVGSGFAAIEELESILVSEIPTQIHQVHNTLPETTVYLETKTTLINKKEFKLITEQLLNQGIYNNHFKIDSDKLELLLATIENKPEFKGGLKEITGTNLEKDLKTKPEEFKLQEIVQNNDNTVDSRVDFGALREMINTDRFNLKCLLNILSSLNDHLHLAAKGEYDGKIEQLAGNVASNVGNRMRGMVASGIISPIMSPIVSNALEFVLERTGLQKALSEGSKLNNELEEQFLIENYIKAGYGVGVSAGDNVSRQELNELSLLSKDIYDKNFINKASDLGYRVVAESNFSITGLKAAILERDGQHVLVIEGTSTKYIRTIGDVIADTQITLKTPPKWQLAALAEFVHETQTKFNIAKIDIATGHSLGGTLATLWGIGAGVQAIAYDSPGDKIIAYEMYGKSKVEAADIIKILSKPNVINSSAEHAGEVLQIDITEQSYDNINLNNKLLTGIKKFISLPSAKTVYGTNSEVIAKEHNVDIEQVSKKFEVSNQDKVLSILDIHCDLKKEQVISNIHKDHEYLIAPKKSEIMNVEIQSFTMNAILRAQFNRHEISEISKALNSGIKLIPYQTFGGDIDIVIRKFTSYEDSHCQEFIERIIPAIQKYPAFATMSHEEVLVLIKNNLPQTQDELKKLASVFIKQK